MACRVEISLWHFCEYLALVDSPPTQSAPIPVETLPVMVFPLPHSNHMCSVTLPHLLWRLFLLLSRTLNQKTRQKSTLRGFSSLPTCENTVREWGCLRILSACENAPRKQDKSLGISVLQNLELFLECVFMFLSGVVERSDFNSDYSLLLVVSKSVV